MFICIRTHLPFWSS